jgi:O-antigen ligase/Flp pilus assembly protein TadD
MSTLIRSDRFARLSLAAALAAPCLILLPRTIQPFYAGPRLATPVLALLAAGLAWRMAGAVLPRHWVLSLGAVLLLWALYGVLGLPGVQRFLGWVVETRRPVFQRAGLVCLGLGLAWEAWRGRTGLLEPGLRRVGLALAALVCISGALSARPDAAVGTLLDWAAYPLVFAAAFRLLDTPRRRRALLLLLLWVAAANALYALLQVAGLDPVAWSRSFGGRPIGFLGNPNFLGGHMALLLPPALALVLDGRGTRAAAWGRWLLAALLGAGLLLSQTRGAWAGALLGCGLLLVLAARRAPGLLRRRRVPLLALGLLGALGLGVLFAAQPRALERVTDVLRGRDVEAERRAFLMRKTAQLAIAHPLLGVGPGNFRVAFPSVQVKGLKEEDYARQPYVVSEHGHNDLLQMAADAGWPAAALWGLLLLLVLRGIVRGAFRSMAGARSGGEALLLLGVFGGLLALTVHGLANFPFLFMQTQATAWALAGLALRAVALPPSPALGEDEAAGEEDAPLAPAPAGRVSLLLILGAVASLGVLKGRGLVMEQFWWMGAGELGLGRHRVAADILLRALDFNRDEDRLWKLHGQAELGRELIWNGIGSLREAVRLNPWDAEAALRLGRACIENRLWEEAENVLTRAATYAPNLPDLWEPLAAAAYNQGHYEKAIQAYDWMIFYGVNLEAAYANKAACLGNQGRLPQALMVLLSGVKVLPRSGKLQVNLAVTYIRLGMRKQAREALAKAAEFSPGDPQLDSLRKVLR